MRYLDGLLRNNARLAHLRWGRLDRETLEQLRFLARKFHLSVATSELQLLRGRWYVTHSGLIGIAQRNKCAGIKTALVRQLCDPGSRRWVFRATVYKSPGSAGFVGFGDADPTNVSTLVLASELRIAETRAVNRALRKAYGIGLCSVEELGSSLSTTEPANRSKTHADHPNVNGSDNGQPRLRDTLCLLIRKYELDPNLVKRYAADFCGTETLRDAGRDLVEAFVSTLAEEAAKDRAALVCKLNSYSQKAEVNS
jgi:hypothetical protein